MKHRKILTVVAVVLLLCIIPLTLSSCMDEKDYYTKEDISSLVTSLEEANEANTKKIAELEEKIEVLLSKCDHEFGEWINFYGNDNVSCENRLFYHICDKCSVLELKSGTQKDHDIVRHTGKAATCTKGGFEDYETCNHCSYTTYTKIAAKGHNYVNGMCSECGGKQSYERDGNYIYFGEYPQSLKEDSVTITTTVDERGYYLGSDGCYYAKVAADPYDSGYKFSTGATVSDGVTYYFKVEPIRWRILSEDGETALILCDSIIANRRYDDSSNNYKNSEIRQWLNETFYETAFTELQREIILITEVDNSVYSTGYSTNPYACEDTEDKIFLLSYREVTNSAYGFSSDYSDDDTARRMQTSDYSRATGAYMNTDSSYYGNGYFWLRSPYFNRGLYARGVLYDGGVYSNYVFDSRDGVVPALQIRL